MDDSLASRVSRYLSRHITFIEASLAALRACDLSTAEGAEACLDGQERRRPMAEQLGTEQVALLKEWAEASPEYRDAHPEVRQLAARAEQLRATLQHAYDEADLAAVQVAAAVELQANTLRRGAGVARRFAVAPEDGEEAGGFVDHKA